MGLAGTRLTFRRGKFYYRHREDDRFENVGTDVVIAKRRADAYNNPVGVYGTVSYWAPFFLADFKIRVKNGDRAQRTLDDYTEYLADGTETTAAGEVRDLRGPLMIFFGKMQIPDIKPNHVQTYLNKQEQLERPVQGNREKACLSSMLSWLLVRDDSPITVNPCMRLSGVVRNEESKRDRYVAHEEYREVFAVATRSERLLMEITYRTLQRPQSDIIRWTTEHLKQVDGRRALSFRQNKTGKLHQVFLTPELEALLPAANKVVSLAERRNPEPLVRKLNGKFYTYTGLYTMLQRSIATANARRAARGIAPMPPFGFRDLKGKGATDMYFIDKVPIEQIQQLLGHADSKTTEIYIKARWRYTAQPNQVNLAG
jgi:integrase